MILPSLWIAAFPASASEHESLPLTLWLLVPGLFAMWAFYGWLISLGGWRETARDFATNQKPNGESFLSRNGHFNLIGHYRFGLHVTLTQAGLHVVPSWPFRFGHCPILLPWSHLRHIGVGEPPLNEYRLTVSLGLHQLTIFLPGKAGPSLDRFVPSTEVARSTSDSSSSSPNSVW